MGADGHIKIWKCEDVLKDWPDAQKLISCLPTAYKDSLNGIDYWHCYWGNNLMVDWTDECDWYVHEVEKEHLAKFVEYLCKSGTHWEVWT